MKRVQILRDIAQNMQSFTGLQGEVTATTDTFELRLHDGSTPGGHRFLPLESLHGVFQPASEFLTEAAALQGGAGFVTALTNGEVILSVLLPGDTNIIIEHYNGDNGAPTIALNTALDFTEMGITGGVFKNGSFSGDGSGLAGVAMEFAVNPAGTAIDPTLNDKLYFGGGSYVLPPLDTVSIGFLCHISATTPSTQVQVSPGTDVFSEGLQSYQIPFGSIMSIISSRDQWHIVNVPPHAVGDIIPTASLVGTPYAVPCDGRALSRSVYSNLFAQINVFYGAGDGATTFNIPDLRGRTMVGQGAGPGLTARFNGQTGGEEAHVLSFNELASHGHAATSNAIPAHNHGGATGVESVAHTHAVNVSGTLLGGVGAASGGQNTASAGTNGPYTTSTESAQHTHPISQDGAFTPTITVANNGGNLAHNNMQPYAVINYLIQL